MSLTPLAYIVNGALLIPALALVIGLLRSGSKYLYAYGITEVQEKLKWRILRYLLLLISLGFIGAAFNAYMGLLY